MKLIYRVQLSLFEVLLKKTLLLFKIILNIHTYILGLQSYKTN